MGQIQSDSAISKSKQKIRYVISLLIAEIIIFSFEYLFEFLSRENLTALQTFTLTCYFEIPNFCIFAIATMTGLLMNEKNINFLKKHRKLLICVISIIFFFAYCFNYQL